MADHLSASPRAPQLAGAEAALAEVADHPRTARASALSILARRPSAEVAAVAHRALALAAVELGDIDGAGREIASARRAARRSGRADRIVEVMTTAAAIRVLQGRPEGALALLDEALAEAPSTLRADVASQRAWVLWQMGRLGESVEVARAVLRHRPVPSPVTVARVQLNLGCCLAELGDYDRADRALGLAAEASRALGHAHAALDADHDRALLAVLRGRIPEALRAFDEVVAGLRRLDAPVGYLLVAQTSALLAANLTTEALAAAHRTVAEVVEHGDRHLEAQAYVLQARAALAAGDATLAARAAAQAGQHARRLGHPALLATVDHLEVMATLAGRAGSSSSSPPPAGRAVGVEGTPPLALIDRLAGAAARLDAVGRRVSATTAHADAVAAAAEAGVVERASASRDALGTRRRSGPALERATAWYGEAVWRAATGDAQGAGRAVRCGLAAVDEHRAVLGATELHAEAAGHGQALGQLGIALALGSGQPRRILAAAERWRAGTVRRAPVLPVGLHDELAALRRLRSEPEAGSSMDGRAVDDPSDDRQVPDAHPARIAALEQRIRHLARQAGSVPSGPARLDPAEIGDRLGDRALVEIVEHRGWLHAVVVAGRRWTVHRLGRADAALTSLDHLAFALRRLGRGHGSQAAVASTRRSALDALDALDRDLTRPLAAKLARRPVVVVPTADLHAVPWGALATLADRPVVVAPSSQWWVGASEAGGRGEVLVAGPGLAGASDEIGRLAATYPSATVLRGDQATATAVATAMDGTALAHVASHGHFRSDNPLFSSLEMVDGPLTVYDLERLGRAPRRVVLAACDAGLPAVRPGDELLGMVGSLLALGAGAVVASTVPVPDVDTTELMVTMHEHLRRGGTLAEALHGARSTLDTQTPSGLVIATAFTCFGTG